MLIRSGQSKADWRTKIAKENTGNCSQVVPGNLVQHRGEVAVCAVAIPFTERAGGYRCQRISCGR